MKHILFILSVFLLLTTGCIKDKSTLATIDIPIIGIDTTGLPTEYTVFQQDTLKIKPTITLEHGNRSHLKYQWVMNAYQGYERIVGTDAELTALITENPSPNSYKLIFTATDSTNNIKAFFAWDITVISPYGQGLVVADTRDEMTTDVSLISAFNFTTALAKDSANRKILYNAYSTANGEKIAGIVNKLNYYKYSNVKNVTFLTDKSFTRIDVNSYKKIDADQKLFLIPPSKIVPNDISSALAVNQHQYIVNNGKGYGRYGQNHQFSYSFLAADKYGYEARKILGLQNPGSLPSGGILYDELNNRFQLLPRMSSMADPLQNFPAFDANNPMAKFDPKNIGNKTCLHMFEGYDKSMISIMKERDQAKYYAYQIRFQNPLSGAMGVGVNDLSQNPDIAKAKFFTSSTSEQVLFYATDEKVYATVVEIGSPSLTNLRYTAKSGDKITGMDIYFGAGIYDPGAGRMYLPNTSSPNDWTKRITVSAAQRLLILSTYNEATKEGKIITIPIETLGVGGLVTDPAYISTYGGFGRITAFGIQI